MNKERDAQIKRIFEGVEDNGWIDKKNTYKKYLNEAMSGKPRKGQTVLTVSGQKYKINSVNGKTIYADVPGSSERFVTFVHTVIPDPKGGNFWAEIMDKDNPKTYYDFK